LKYKDAKDALRQYDELPVSVKLQMAKVYKEAFKLPPWREEYDAADLVKNYFPEMIGEFSPGILVIADNMKDGVIGFCQGGLTTTEDLATIKYKSNPGQIQESIQKKGEIGEGEVIFYENEMCVLPSEWKQGVGKALNKVRLDYVDELGIDIVVGRSINTRLLEMKEKAFPERGFSYSKFLPTGDNFTVNEIPTQRFCYVAKRI
jgi:hypothetical protein